VPSRTEGPSKEEALAKGGEIHVFRVIGAHALATHLQLLKLLAVLELRA
jgi:hypothetical protein